MFNMTIYQRTYTRQSLVIDVNVKFKGEKLGHTLTRNIDPFGAFIELLKHGLVINDFIEMHFINKDENNKDVVQKGIVVHCSKEGVGILFAYDTDEFRTMLDKKTLDQDVRCKISNSSLH
jgi:hypothetical protein